MEDLLVSVHRDASERVAGHQRRGAERYRNARYVGPFSQAIEKARASIGLGELVIHTNPQVVGTFSTGLSTLNTYISP